MSDKRSSLTEVLQRAVDIRERYEQMEIKKYGRRWSREELALGLAGDVGTLMKLVIASEGVRDIPETEAKLAHELSDCLWSIIVLAHEYDIDLEAAFFKTMDQLEARIQSEVEKS